MLISLPCKYISQQFVYILKYFLLLHRHVHFRLRLGLLNEEMKDSEIGVTGDETFNDVVRDFSQLACSHPERLQRRNETTNLPHMSE